MKKIKATDVQMKQMAANAINASRPVGMGFLHFNEKDNAKPEDIEISNDELFLDYIGGRMVKFNAWKVEGTEDQWEVRDGLHLDYQSWISTYPTWEVLAKSVGASVID